MQADHSRLPDGLTLSRASFSHSSDHPLPSPTTGVTCHDYYMHRSDDEFVRSFLPGIQAVLGWFERRLREDGLMGGLEWLNFTDWNSMD